jgi:hypothetical protein
MRRPDLKTFDSTHGIGHFDDLIEFDRSTRSVLFGFDLTHAITLPRGDSVKLDFTRPDDARRCQFFGVESEVLSGGTRAARWSSQGTPCFVALPPLRVNAGIDLRFAVDGEAIDAFGRAVPIPVVAMARSGAFFMRFVVQDAVTVPRDVQGLRLDIIPLIDSYTVVRSITIRAE